MFHGLSDRESDKNRDGENDNELVPAAHEFHVEEGEADYRYSRNVQEIRRSRLRDKFIIPKCVMRH